MKGYFLKNSLSLSPAAAVRSYENDRKADRVIINTGSESRITRSPIKALLNALNSEAFMYMDIS